MSINEILILVGILAFTILVWILLLRAGVRGGG